MHSLVDVNAYYCASLVGVSLLNLAVINKEEGLYNLAVSSNCVKKKGKNVDLYSAYHVLHTSNALTLMC